MKYRDGNRMYLSLVLGLVPTDYRAFVSLTAQWLFFQISTMHDLHHEYARQAIARVIARPIWSVSFELSPITRAEPRSIQTLEATHNMQSLWNQVGICCKWYPVLSLVALLSVVPACFGQGRAALSGKVVDSTGALITSATLTVTESKTGESLKLSLRTVLANMSFHR